MGHYAFLIAAGFIVAGSVLAMGLRRDTNDARQETVRVLYKEEARDAALTAMNLTLRRIVVDEGEWAGAAKYQLPEQDYKRARFQTWITPIGVDTLDIMSRGWKEYINRGGDYVDTTHTVDVRIVRTQLAGGIPPAFEVAIITNEEMDIGGDFQVSSYDGVNNADVHANGTLTTHGNTFLVEGYGSYTTDENVKQPENFQPLVDLGGGGSAVVQNDSIPIPQIDIPALRSASQSGGVYIGTDVNLDVGTIPYDSFGDWALGLGLADPEIGTKPDKPFIYFSEGEINFSGEKTLGGWGAFVSVESMHTNSGTQIHGLVSYNEEGNTVTQMGIFTAGDLMINGTADFTATLYAAGHTTFNGTASITGGAVLNTVGKFTGTFNMVWAGFNEGFVEYFGGTLDIFGPTIAAWAEW